MTELSEAEKRVIMDSFKYGTGILKTGIRKWWNPLRYIKGHVYQKSVSLKEVFK
jgi:hypothetical protein